MFSSQAERDATLKLIEIRNLVVHKRGVIDNRYIRRTGDTRTSPGERIPLGEDEQDTMFDVLPRVVADVDGRAVDKWTLPTVAAPLVENKMRTDSAGEEATAPETEPGALPDSRLGDD